MKIFENGKIREMTKKEVAEYKQSTTQVSVDELQKKLCDSDYKIIKCYEYSLVGLPLPYDLEKLHEKRQAIRDEINQKESQI